MTRFILRFFDKLEDKTRAKLSRAPIVYAFLGGVGVVLFWRGVWHLADDFGVSSALSVLIGVSVLLITGVFVSAFVGNRLIISGISGEKKLAERTEEEILEEEQEILDIKSTLDRVEKKISDIESKL